MKPTLTLLLCAALLAGCSAPAPDIEATSGAALSATQTALAPSPAESVDVYSLSEEELAVLIAQEVEQALYLADSTGQYTAAQASDGSLSAEETQQAVVLLSDAEAALEDVLYLMEAFYSLYGENADELIATLSQMEGELQAISASLDQIAAVLEQGAAALEQLNQAAAEIQARAANLQGMAEQWRNMLPVILAMNEENALNTLPDLEAANRLDALEYLRNFGQELRGALADRKISPPELESISRWGANSRAALLKYNLDSAADLDGRIRQLTSFAARGQWPQIAPALDSFDLALPGR